MFVDDSGGAFVRKPARERDWYRFIRYTASSSAEEHADGSGEGHSEGSGEQHSEDSDGGYTEAYHWATEYFKSVEPPAKGYPWAYDSSWLPGYGRLADTWSGRKATADAASPLGELTHCTGYGNLKGSFSRCRMVNYRNLSYSVGVEL